MGIEIKTEYQSQLRGKVVKISDYHCFPSCKEERAEMGGMKLEEWKPPS